MKACRLEVLSGRPAGRVGFDFTGVLELPFQIGETQYTMKGRQIHRCICAAVFLFLKITVSAH
jgi:hypothetical protein